MKYSVDVKEVHSASYEITSDKPLSRAEILEKAHALLEEGTDEICLEFSHTLDDDVWTIRSEAGDFVT